ncbi:hypothetical protein EC973_009670 [Apophysomyces ossiformis]|uniref:Uncharacterized protein n=1 Tax=Apophysomyces ossiformis TaxID=679940 RepID=A0A8H7EN89_9FUNG|nr:hypothetical protein EC973_009670 [Apophysomyces ossiformis]
MLAHVLPIQAKLSLYLYYKKNYAYQHIKSWTNLTTSDGSLQVLVDDSWFPNPLPRGSGNLTWTMYGFYLPAGLDPTYELTNPSSLYPRPFNFSVVQFAYPNDSNPASPPSSGVTNSQGVASSGNSDGALPGWSIAVIVIAVLAFIMASAAIIWAILLSRRRKRNNKLSPAGSTMTPSGIHPDMSAPMNEKQQPLPPPKPSHDVTSIHSTTPIVTVPAPARSLASPYNSTSELASTSTDQVSPSISPQHPNSSGYPTSPQRSPKSSMLSSTDATALGDTFRHILYRPDWPGASGNEGDEELRRKRLGEQLLQRQLAEDGTSVKHAERRPTRIRSIAEIESKAVLERKNSKG